MTAPIATSANGVMGINISGSASTSTFNVYYNTVYLNNTLSGTGFGSSGISVLASATATTSTLNLRNNIIVNTSVQNGTGLAIAYRRSAGTAGTLANYASSSNNNLFYAGAPGPSNLIYTDGTSSAQTMNAYKTGVFTAGTIAPRDSASFAENPTFLSTVGSDPNFLHMNTTVPTQIESGGAPISGVTDDFDGNPRNATTPDVGADEFAGVLLDVAGPVISYTTLGNSVNTTSRTFTISVTDVGSGVPTSGGGLPQVYFRKGMAGAYATSQCVFTSGSNYNCTMTYSAVGGVMVGDTIQYYVMAQDNAMTPNVSSNPATGASGFTASPPAATTPTTTPNSFLLSAGISGTLTIDGSTFTSLTNNNAQGIFNFLNNEVLTGNVTVLINFTVTIRPQGSPRTVSGTTASNALIRLNGATNVTIDGSLADADGGGIDRSLTIANNSATSPTVINIGSVGTTPVNVSNNTISGLSCAGTAAACYAIGSFAPNTIIAGNSISNVTQTGGTAVWGIATAANDITVERNNVSGVINNNTRTFAAIGIDINAGNNATLKNNFVSNITGDMSGGAAFSTSFGIFGVRVTAGAGHKIYNNSVNLFGARADTPNSSLLTAALGVVTTASTGMDVRNNILANNITGGTTSVANVSVYLPSGGGAGMGLLWNNNSYYYGTDSARAGAGQAGTTAGTNFFVTLAALKGYTGTLGNASNDDASLASTGARPFLSNTNLHIGPVVPERNSGVTIASVTNDFDGDNRPQGSGYDIGADERLNTAPVSVNDANSVTEDMPPNPVMGNILTNDTDIDLDTLVVDSAYVGTGIALTYGTLDLAADGTYTYTLNNAHPAVQALPAGGMLMDSFDYRSTDGFVISNLATLTVTIHGTNDVASISGDTTGDVTEDGSTVDSGVLNVMDPDTGESSFQVGGGAAVISARGMQTSLLPSPPGRRAISTPTALWTARTLESGTRTSSRLRTEVGA